jgi:hypothetical protein
MVIDEVNVLQRSGLTSDFKVGAILVRRAVRVGGGADGSEVFDMEGMRGAEAIFLLSDAIKCDLIGGRSASSVESLELHAVEVARWAHSEEVAVGGERGRLAVWRWRGLCEAEWGSKGGRRRMRKGTGLTEHRTGLNNVMTLRAI